MKDEIPKENINNNNQNEMLNYKGYFVEHGRDEEKKFFEYGAHFSYKELFLALMKIKNQKTQKENIMKILPKKTLNIERNNQKDKKIEENINNIIKEFKMKTRSRNIAQQENKISLNQNLNQLTYIPLNNNQNKININNHINSINKNINLNKNILITNIDDKIRQINNKYNITRNREQKSSFDFPIFFTDNKNIKILKENNTTNNLTNNSNSNINNKINNNINLYKSYQNQIKKRKEIKLDNTNNNNFIKNNFINDKANIYKKSRILSYNFENFLNKCQYEKFKFSPLKKIPTKNIPISRENYVAFKFNNIIKNKGNINNSYHNKNYKLKKIINQGNIILNNINSFSADNKKKHISNSSNIDKISHIKNNISNISNTSLNNSKNITFQNMLNDLNHSKKYFNKNRKNNITKEGALTNFNQSLQKNKIHNLFKLLNKHEKISRNKNINYFLNNTSFMQNTQQNDKNRNLQTTNTKHIFLNLNNILMNKERNRPKLSNHLLNNSRNINFNSNKNKFFNTSYINNTTQNNLNQNQFIKRIQTTQNNNNTLNMRKKPKKNNVNINININNNSKIIYNKVYEYKSPLPNINNSKIIKNSIPVKISNSNHINNPVNSRILKNVRSNNISNNKNIKFLNIQLPKKKLLNKYNNKIYNNYSNLFS